MKYDTSNWSQRLMNISTVSLLEIEVATGVKSLQVYVLMFL